MHSYNCFLCVLSVSLALFLSVFGVRISFLKWFVRTIRSLRNQFELLVRTAKRKEREHAQRKICAANDRKMGKRNMQRLEK